MNLYCAKISIHHCCCPHVVCGDGSVEERDDDLLGDARRDRRHLGDGGRGVARGRSHGGRDDVVVGISQSRQQTRQERKPGKEAVIIVVRWGSWDRSDV